MTKISHNWIIAAVVLSVLIGATSCARKPRKDAAAGDDRLYTSASKVFEPRKINHIAIFPLEADTPESVSKSDLDMLNADLVRVMQVQTSLSIENISNEKKVTSLSASLEAKPVSLRERALEFGSSLGVQGVLVGTVQSYGVSQKNPADGRIGSSAGFKLELIDVKSARVVWEGSYSDQNQAVSDNLLKAGDIIKQGFKSKSPKQMMHDGFESVAKNLEQSRSSAFVPK